MKGCFVLHRRFAYLGHYVARHLKDRGSVQDFCGIVYTKPSLDFMKAQTDIEYGTLLYDEEIHARYNTEKLDPAYLDALEKEYGLPSLLATKSSLANVNPLFFATAILEDSPEPREVESISKSSFSLLPFRGVSISHPSDNAIFTPDSSL